VHRQGFDLQLTQYDDRGFAEPSKIDRSAPGCLGTPTAVARVITPYLVLEVDLRAVLLECYQKG